VLGKSRAEFDAEMPKREPGAGAPAIETSSLSEALKDLSRLMSVRDAALNHFVKAAEGVDITARLVECGDDYCKCCEEELANFDEVQIDLQKNLEEQTAILTRVFEENAKFVAARSNDAVTQQREAFLLKIESAVATFESLHKQIVEGRNFYQSIVTRVEQLSQTCEDQHVMVGVMHSDFLEQKQNRDRSISQEASDAELAARLANECNFSVDDSAAARQAQEVADAEFAAEMAREDQQEAQQMQQRASNDKADQAIAQMEGKKEETGGGSWMSWLSGGGSKDESGGEGLNQPLTRNEFPAAQQGGGSSGGYAPPVVDMSDAPPLPAYTPPKMGGGAPPPVFNAEDVGRGGGGGGGSEWVPQPPPLPAGGGGGGVAADSDKVTTLCEMGFGIEKVKKALIDHNNNAENALNQLISE